MASVLLHLINPEKNQKRFYLVMTGPTLFEPFAVIRWWGRIDGHSQEMITPCESAAAAEAFAKELVEKKIKRGYIPVPIMERIK
jgi:predicted DNA-binding WGR domain protein